MGVWVEFRSIRASVFHFGRLSTVAIHRQLPSLAASQPVVSPSMPCPWRCPGLSPPHNHSPRFLNRHPSMLMAHTSQPALCLPSTNWDWESILDAAPEHDPTNENAGFLAHRSSGKFAS